MTIDELLLEWKSDSLIDSHHLDVEALRCGMLHSKYLEILTNHKLMLSKHIIDLADLRRLKFRYYRGELSREELITLDWHQYQGIKPIKNELDEILNGDEDLNKKRRRIDYLKVFIETVESVMNAIKNRNWELRNAIEYRKFMAGA